jgi:acetyl-CoA C-acetyltransferase
MKMGNLFERFSEVAANNPYAWTQKSYSAEEIISPSPNNRNVCYPYTKRMCSNMFVDQSAAILITSEDIAKKLEVPKKRWVYLRGASDFQNIFAITRRPKLATSPAARIGSKVALNQAGLMLDDIDRFDIYSCFPSIVEIISDEIGIIKDDTRDLTITGGLPFFGGPWSNYSLHAIATAVNIIQKNPEITIMVIANGGYNTKQSFGIYGNLPPQKGFDENDAKELQNQILEKILPEPVEKANGVCKILGYTVIYNRDGTHKYGIALGAMENKRHTLATLNGTDEELAQLEHHEIVGRTYRVYFDERSQKNIINLTEIKN